ncbi:MAG TPA: hypothetical protein VK900_09370 [Anaerolineales bacterium]|nr:hypothetical protein [Anaerolineales bacterium]
MSTEPKPSDSSDKEKKGSETQVWIALIGALTTIILALLSFPPLIARLTPVPTLTIAPSPAVLSNHTPTANTVIDLPLSMDTPPVTITVTLTAPVLTSPVITDTPSAPIGMHPRLVADRTSGKAPLTVKLDARDSFLRAPGGEIYSCRGGACEYTWEVYSGGQRIGRPQHNSTGTFQYTFGNKGIFFITVWVCRGGGSSDCNGSGAQIVVN